MHHRQDAKGAKNDYTNRQGAKTPSKPVLCQSRFGVDETVVVLPKPSAEVFLPQKRCSWRLGALAVPKSFFSASWRFNQTKRT